MREWLEFNFKHSLLIMLSFMILACSSQEYTTAKLAVQQSDWSKASEWLIKAMEIEPNNPVIPIVLAIEIYARESNWIEMNKMQCSIKMQTIVRIDHHHGTENHNLWNLIDILRANIVISDNYHKEEVIKR